MNPSSTAAPLHLLVRAGEGSPRSMSLTGITNAHRVSDLLAALGGPPGSRATVDGRPVAADARLVSCLFAGAMLDVSCGGTTPARPPSVRLRWRAGPDSGRVVDLSPGRYVIGRSTGGPLSTDDPAMAPHHAVVDVVAPGRLDVTDLGIGRPVEVAGRLGDEHRTNRAPGSATRITIGATVVEVDTPRPPDVTGPPDRPLRGRDVPEILPAVSGSECRWTMPYVRSPRIVPGRSDRTIDLPDLTPTSVTGVGVVGVLSLGVSLLGGIALALVLRQPLMFLMVGLGALGGIATWTVQLVQGRRGRRRDGRHRKALLDAFSAELERRWLDARSVAASLPSLYEAVDSATTASRLWERRSDHDDAFVVALGVGDVHWDPPVEPSGRRPDAEVAAIVDRFAVLPDSTETIDLVRHRAIGVTGGDVASALVRSMLLQLAVSTGPADWELLVVVSPERSDSWSWTSWLPHLAPVEWPRPVRPDELDDVVRGWRDGRDAGDARRLVVVVDGAAPLTARTAPLRRLLGLLGGRATLLVLPDAGEAVPAICETVVGVTHDGVLTLIEAGGLPTRGRVTGCTAETATAIAARLARWTDPELDRDGGDLADDLSLPDVLGSDALRPHEIARSWNEAGCDPRPIATLGRAADGVVEVDLVADGPHVLVAGTTGAGKSELLRTMVTSLALGSAPADLSFVLIDYKGGSAFDACADLPHVAGVVTDLDGHLAARVLRSLDAELRRREALLREAGAADLAEYRSSSDGSVAIARLVIVVDEFAALASELPDFLSTLVGIAQRGRSLGVHLVLATQRPGGVLSDDIRANTNVRIALRVQDDHDAMDVVGDVRPARFSRRSPGRAAIRLGADELVVFQTARTTVPEDAPSAPPRLEARPGRPGGRPASSAAPMARIAPGAPTTRALHAESERSVLAAAVAATRRAVVLAAGGPSGAPPVHRPWRPPLASTVEADALDPAAMVLVDDPDRQDQRGHAWDPRSGHLLLAGVLGSGTTTALATVARTLARRTTPDELHLYVLDAGAEPRLAGLDELDHVGAVVRSPETFRRRRLLHRLDRTIDERSRSGDVAPTIVLLIDGFATLRAGLLDLPDGSEAAWLDRIVHDGPRHGVVLVATVDQPSAAPLALLSRSAERWVFRLADPIDAAVLGVAPALAPGPSAPPGRCVVSSLGLEAQVALPGAAGAVAARRSTSEPAVGLPDGIPDRPGVLSTDDLPAGVELRDRWITVADGADAADDLGAGVHEAHRVDPVNGTEPIGMPIGIADASGRAVVLTVHDGEHVLVGGPARSGRTTALATIARQFRAQRRGGWVGVVSGRRSVALQRHAELGPLADAVGDAAAVIDALATVDRGRAAMLLVDDADAVDDTDGALAALLHSRRPGLVVVAAARPDTLRAAHGHWTSIVRRSRKGLLLGAVGDLDGDLLGVLLPRGRAVRSRPGDALLVADGQIEELQVAVPPSAVSPARAQPAAGPPGAVSPDRAAQVPIRPAARPAVDDPPTRPAAAARHPLPERRGGSADAGSAGHACFG